jgi:hypothetical protein
LNFAEGGLPYWPNKVFLIDTDMLNSYYPGDATSALEICGNGKFVAVYLDQQAVLLDPAGTSRKTGLQSRKKLSLANLKVYVL